MLWYSRGAVGSCYKSGPPPCCKCTVMASDGQYPFESFTTPTQASRGHKQVKSDQSFWTRTQWAFRGLFRDSPCSSPIASHSNLEEETITLTVGDQKFPPAVVERVMKSDPKRYQVFLYWPPWKPALLRHPKRNITNQPTDITASGYITWWADKCLSNVLSNLTKTSPKLRAMAAQAYEVQVCRAEELFRYIQEDTPTRVPKEEKMKAQQPGKLITYPGLLWALLSLTSQC